jgi:hypothetical protein
METGELGTKVLGQDNGDRTTRTGQMGQDSWDRLLPARTIRKSTTRTGNGGRHGRNITAWRGKVEMEQQRQGNYNRTAMKEKTRQNSHNKTTGTGQARQIGQTDWPAGQPGLAPAWTGQIGEEAKHMTTRTRARTDNQDRTTVAGQLGQDRGWPEHDRKDRAARTGPLG